MLAKVLVDARTPSYDLLELRERANVGIEDDQLAGLCIDAGGHQLGGRGDHRVTLVGVDKGVEVAFALFVVSRDLHDVFAVLGH